MDISLFHALALLFQSDENEFCTRTFSIPNKVPVRFDRVSKGDHEVQEVPILARCLH